MRKRRSEPVYDMLLDYLQFSKLNNIRTGAYPEAVSYACNHLPRLKWMFEDGRIEVDNNQIENKIRPLALGRKNYMFAGSNKGAERIAMMYSFMSSCKANDINPREWLEDVLIRVESQDYENLTDLLPGQWKKMKSLEVVA